MLNIFLGHGLGAFDRGDGPSRKNSDAELSPHGDTCVVLDSNTQVASDPHLSSSMYMGGHGRCYVPPKDVLLTHDLDFLNKKHLTNIIAREF